MAIPFTNFTMLGAFAATTGWVGLSSIIEASYSKFSGKTARNNEKSARMAYETTKVISAEFAGITETIGQRELAARKIKLDLYPGMVINKASNAKTGSWRTRKPVLVDEKCNFCGLCATLCPEGVLIASKEAGWLPDLTQCKGCGICANECPRDAIEMVLER
jgi:pyruvate ferredoxin oxidoreductase delta subunit